MNEAEVGKIAQRVTEIQVTKQLLDAAVYLAKGMGFDVTYTMPEVAARPGDIGTVTEGVRDLMGTIGMVMAGLSINPNSVMPGATIQRKPTQKGGIILAQ